MVMKNSSPLVILALDTGDFDAIKKWSAEGYLPTIASLMQRGCWGHTTGPELVCEYGVGTTLFSGMSRSQHGYYYFRQLEPKTYNLQNVIPNDYHAPPFWAALGDRDQKVLIIDVPDVHPVSGLAGLQLANWATHHGSIETPMSEPADLLDDVRRIFGERIVVHSKLNGTFEDDMNMYERLLERIERKGRLCESLLDRDDFDLINIIFSETDPASTQFWPYRANGSSGREGADRNVLSHAIRDIYVAIDRQFGKILERLPDDANVFLLSLYGIQDEYPTSTLIESFCQQLGYHGLREPGNHRAALSPLSLARRFLPESFRVALSRRVSQATQERILADKLRNTTDWSTTTAFAIPSLFTSFVRVNLRGREPQGIVEPGDEYRKVLDRMENDLFQLTDAKTGGPAVKSVTRTVDAFGCEPHLSLPDLFVEWQPLSHMLERVEHPRATLVQRKPDYCPTSQEKLSGFFAAAGPAIHARGEIGGIELLDLAPTFLSLLGNEPPEQMRGTVLSDVLDRPSVAGT